MLIHLPRLISRWSRTHSRALACIGGVSISRYATAVTYTMLPVTAAFLYGEWWAGVFLGVFNFFQAFIGDPIAGNLADRIGSKIVVLIGIGFVAMAGILWFFIPLNNLVALSVFAALVFLGFSFRDESLAYLLRVSGREEGGLIFGFAENVYAVAHLLAALSVPYFVAGGRSMLMALIMVLSSVFAFIILVRLPNDREAILVNGIKQSFNPLVVIKRGWHFVRKNQWHPILTLGSFTFEGIFYGVLWFAIPLEIANLTNLGSLEGLGLGIYEIVTIILAGVSGYLADRYNWLKIHNIGWILAAAGAVGFIFNSSPFWLIALGAVIGIGNNFFAFAASHALEKYDDDHDGDGSFFGLTNMLSDAGYAIGPIVAGFFYARGGFRASLGFAAAVTVILAIAMIITAQRVRKRLS